MKHNKNNSSVVSIEINDNYVKLCQTQRRKKETIHRCFALEVKAKTDTAYLEALNILKRCAAITTARVYLNIPRHKLMLRCHKFPGANPKQLHQMVKIEAERQVPYSSDDISVGYKVLDKTKDEFSNVLIAIGHNNITKRFMNIAEKAEFVIENISVGSEPLFLWNNLFNAKKNEDKDKVIMLLNVDSDFVSIVILNNNIIVFTRSIPCDNEGNAKDEKIISEIQSTVSIFSKENRSDVYKAYVTGAKSQANAILPLLKNRLGCLTEHIPQTTGITANEAPVGIMDKISFVEQIGINNAREYLEIDLLPQVKARQNKLHHLLKDIQIAVVLLISVLVSTSGIAGKLLINKTSEVRAINRKIDEIKPQVERVKQLQKDIDAINEKFGRRVLAVDILREIYAVTPKKVVYYNIDYDSKKALTLKGNAPGLNTLIDFIKVLEDSKFFVSPKIRYTTKRTVKSNQVTEFEILCELPGA